MRHLPQKLSNLHRRLHQAATVGKAKQRQISSQGEHAHLVQQSCQDHVLLKHSSTTPALFAGNSGEQAGLDISRLAPYLQQEWDHEANAHLGSIIIAPQSNRKVWWSSGMCKAKQPHRWQATVCNCHSGASCPHDTGRAVCPCNDLAHHYPKVAADWDWEANGGGTPKTVTAFSTIKAAWKCGLCGHRWSTHVHLRTFGGTGCPRCGREASSNQTRQPSISSGPPYLLAEWDWEANETHGWHPDKVTLGSNKKVHWARPDECKLGLVHRWQASPNSRHLLQAGGSPFPSGTAVCACNSLAVQCPEAADLWDSHMNGDLTPADVAKLSVKVVAWKGPGGSQWHQAVREVVNTVRRRHISQLRQRIEVTTMNL